MSQESFVSPALLRRSLLALAAALAVGAVPAQAANDNAHVIVAFKPGAAAAVRQAVAAARGSVKVELTLADAIAVELPTAALAGLSRNPNVAYIEEDVKRYPLALTSPSTGTPYATGQLVPYGIKMVQADQLSDSNAGTRKVCIIDSGYSAAHEDLKANVDAGNVNGVYDSGTGNWFTDENHHGTHVAGTVAAVNNSGVGVVGVNPNSKLKLHIVKVFGADGWAYSSTLSVAAVQCRDYGANVISMSLGGSFKSRSEQTTFDSLYTKNNILSIAAAGNGGNSRVSYPAGYASVVSVAAVDENRAKASFSQYNSDVEISGPGVGVLSTVPMGAGSLSSLTVGTTAYAAGDMDGSPKTTVTAPLADFGLGDVVNTAVSGKVCLIARGTIDFATKVSNCQASGGVGAVIYNNVAGGFSGTLGTTATTIPSVTASDTDGTAMKGQLGQNATVTVAKWNYAYFDGTSMATPHVSAVAALVWSFNLNCSATDVRNTLNKTAVDLGTAGRDVNYGFGLVQALAAKDKLVVNCGK